MNYYHGSWHNGAFVGFHILGFLVFVVLICILVRYCIGGRLYYHHNTNASTGNSAIEIVKQRYAKGEISKAEYDKILNDLK